MGYKNEVIKKLVWELKLQNRNFWTHKNKTKSLYLKNWASYRITNLSQTPGLRGLRTGCFVKSCLLNPCLLSLAPPAPQKATLFPTTIINSLDGTIGNICNIWHSTGPLFWITEKYIIYLTNLKGHLGKISSMFWGTTSGPKIVLAEPKTRFYNSAVDTSVFLSWGPSNFI